MCPFSSFKTASRSFCFRRTCGACGVSLALQRTPRKPRPFCRTSASAAHALFIAPGHAALFAHEEQDNGLFALVVDEGDLGRVRLFACFLLVHQVGEFEIGDWACQRQPYPVSAREPAQTERSAAFFEAEMPSARRAPSRRLPNKVVSYFSPGMNFPRFGVQEQPLNA